MAKHAHRLMLHQKKTWRCMLPGCTYFIHSGLEFTLPGKRSVCWECGDEFTLSESSITDAREGDDMPKCEECTSKGQLEKLRETSSDIGHARDCDGVLGLPCSCHLSKKSVESEPFIRTSIVQVKPVKPILDSSIHGIHCDKRIGGICTCGASR